MSLAPTSLTSSSEDKLRHPVLPGNLCPGLFLNTSFPEKTFMKSETKRGKGSRPCKTHDSEICLQMSSANWSGDSQISRKWTRVEMLALLQHSSPVVLPLVVLCRRRKMGMVGCHLGPSPVVRRLSEVEEAMDQTDSHIHPGMVLSVAAERLALTIRHSRQIATMEDPCPSSSRVTLLCQTKA